MGSAIASVQIALNIQNGAIMLRAQEREYLRDKNHGFTDQQ